MSVDTLEESAELASELNLSTIRLTSDPSLTAIDAWGVRHDGKDIAVPAVFGVATDGTILFSYIGESMTDRPTTAELPARFDTSP